MNKFKIGDPVLIDLEMAGVLKNGTIKAIIREEHKTYYNIEFLTYSNNDEVESTLIEHVDEFYCKETLN